MDVAQESEEKNGMLCLATYNVWNSNAGMPERAHFLVEEIAKVDPDILCLQEVRDAAMAEEIARELRMRCFFAPHEDEGICVLSKHPVVEAISWTAENHAQFAAVAAESKTIGIVNLHLPWNSAILREKSIVSLLEKVEGRQMDFLFLLGDFNCGDHSSVIRTLLGECSLLGVEANPCFFDLALAAAQFRKTPAEATLNFRDNPRFAGDTLEVNQRFDRILLQNPYPKEFPRLMDCDIFGTKVYAQNGLAASDHYGVFAKLAFHG